MRYVYLFLLCATMVMATVGCGGGSATSNDPFAGSYVGTFVNNSSGSGVIAFVVYANGQVVGRAINTTEDATSAISGTITSAGLATLTDSAGTALGNFTLNAGSLSGTLNSTSNGATTITINAASTANGAIGSYAGSFSGSYLDSNSSTGTLSLIAAGGGTVTALLQNLTGVGTTFTATGTISSAGALSLNGNGETITGTLTFNGLSQLNGPLNTSNGQTITPILSSP